jgi:lysozyme
MPYTFDFREILPGMWHALPPHMRARALVFAIVSVAAVACSSGDENTCKQTGQALSVCAGTNIVKGIDVSYYQGTIDFTKVKASGRDFAIARVSDGTGFADPKFSTYWPAMKSAGLIRGVYQFFRPAQDPIAQANLLVDTIEKLGRDPTDLPPVMDIEVTDNQSATTVRANMKKWLDQVEAKIGRKPIIYTAAFMSSTIGNGWTAYPLWVANYGVMCPTMPSDWTKWKFWQSSSTGSIPGISGGVDVDEWNGTLQELVDWANPMTPMPDAGTGPGTFPPPIGTQPSAPTGSLPQTTPSDPCQ